MYNSSEILKGFPLKLCEELKYTVVTVYNNHEQCYQKVHIIPAGTYINNM